MRLAAIIALVISSPANSEELNWLDVRIDSIEMRIPDLPRLKFHWEHGTSPETLENANRFVLSRGGAHRMSSPMDDTIANLSSKVDFGRVTLISIGPTLPTWSVSVSCSEDITTILDHEVNLFCNPLNSENRITRYSQNLVSDQLRFFDMPVRLSCISPQLDNDPFGVSCRLRSRMPNGLSVNVDVYLNEKEEWAWPNLHGSLEDWQSNIVALEVALNSMLVH